MFKVDKIIIRLRKTFLSWTNLAFFIKLNDK